MTKWLLRCTKCGNVRVLEVGYDLRAFKKMYIFCPKCRRNTHHEIVSVQVEE